MNDAMNCPFKELYVKFTNKSCLMPFIGDIIIKQCSICTLYSWQSAITLPLTVHVPILSVIMFRIIYALPFVLAPVSHNKGFIVIIIWVQGNPVY